MNSHGDIRVHLRIIGRVQGVGFRWWAAREARALALAGTVRNDEDGSVEVEAEGPPAEVARLRALLEEGPPHAFVERLEDLPPTRGRLPTPFAIRA